VKRLSIKEIVRRTGHGRNTIRRALRSVEPPRYRLPSHGLTTREREVLGLLARGLPQHAIARELFISPQTVATHIQRTLSKLRVHSRAEAVALPHKERLVDGRDREWAGVAG
jgi:DNA-binding NarL/FixJ family response regulator